MVYFSEQMPAQQMVQIAGSVAIPGGRENGDVLAWMAENGLDVPEFAGRCLHRRNHVSEIL